MPAQQSSTPHLFEFVPKIPYQRQVIVDVRKNFDYSKGVHEILLSGAVGSAKSLLAAHLAVTHCMMFPRARVMLARRALPDLKDTLIQKILEHLDGALVEGAHYSYNRSTGDFRFANGSEMIARSWADQRYKKMRSLELSAAVIEELTENDSVECEAALKEIKARIGRLRHVRESWIVACTNPDSPAHFAYEYWISGSQKFDGRYATRWDKLETRHTYYSVTHENPFLHPMYVQQLRETLTAAEARRMLDGQWIDIKAQTIYYAYKPDLVLIDKYEPDPRKEIIISYDFNIGLDKPMSCIVAQVDDSGNHVTFDECVLYSARTLDTLDELSGRGWIRPGAKIRLHGDASGVQRTTNYNKSDYDIIVQYLSNAGCQVIYDVPAANPPVRKRHIVCNGALQNADGKCKVRVVRDKCKTLVKALNLCKLREGSSGYAEDDSDSFQHVGTAWSYSVYRVFSARRESTCY